MNKMGMESNKKDNCPYISLKLKECRYMGLDSQSVAMSVKYCLDNFKACDIYILLKREIKYCRKENRDCRKCK